MLKSLMSTGIWNFLFSLQFYDVSANAVDEDQYTQIMRNHGPPPSYEIAVAMKNPIGKCHLCHNKIRLSCSCDTNEECDIDKTDNLTVETIDQFLNVKNISQNQKTCYCKSVCTNQNQCCGAQNTCSMCEEEIPCNEDVQNGNSQDGYCQCSNYKNLPNNGLRYTLRNESETINGHDINDNVPSTSGDTNCFQNVDANCNYEESDDEIDTEDGEFDSLNANGLIRVDMRKIIDQTGLPTYEAALKLESTGYV